MLAIAAGGYGGMPSPYVVNIHYLIGYILKNLYTWVPSVNWFTVWYLFMYMLSFAFILYIIIKSNRRSRTGMIICLGIEILSFYMLLNFFSFTVAAYALLTAGMMGAAYADKTRADATSGHHRVMVISTVLFIFAAMMRTDVINTAIVISAVYGITATISLKNRRILWNTALIIAVLTSVELLACATNTYFLSRDVTEAAFYEWGETRSKALDCTPVPYDEKLFLDNGFSKASYDACYGAFYYVRDAVSMEKLKHLIDWNTGRYHPHVIGFIKSHIGAYMASGYRRIWQALFVFVIIANMVLGDRKAQCKAFALYAAVIAADYAYHFIGRPLIHVMMPTYVMGSLLSTTLLEQDDTIIENSSIKKHRMRCVVCEAGFLILVAVAILTIYKDPARYSMTLTEEDAAVLQEGREYMRDHPNSIFIAVDPTVFAISTDEDMWHNRYATEPYNLAGNWEIYSLPSNTMLESYGIDPNDPGRDLVDNDRVIFLSSRTESFDPNKSYISELYKEYYGMEGVKFIPIDNLKNWTSWRLSGN